MEVPSQVTQLSLFKRQVESGVKPGNKPAQVEPLTPAVSTPGSLKGDEYKYRIIATNGEGSSPASSESLEQAVVAGTPEAPVFLSLSSLDGTNDISWSTPAANGSPVTGYTLQVLKGLIQVGIYGAFSDVTGCCAYSIKFLCPWGLDWRGSLQISSEEPPILLGIALGSLQMNSPFIPLFPWPQQMLKEFQVLA